MRYMRWSYTMNASFSSTTNPVLTTTNETSITQHSRSFDVLKADHTKQIIEQVQNRRLMPRCMALPRRLWYLAHAPFVHDVGNGRVDNKRLPLVSVMCMRTIASELMELMLNYPPAQ